MAASIFPDSLWVADDGPTSEPSCWDHRRVRETAGNFIQKVVEPYRSSRTVLVWDVAAEPGLWISGTSLMRERSVAQLGEGLLRRLSKRKGLEANRF